MNKYGWRVHRWKVVSIITFIATKDKNDSLKKSKVQQFLI